MNKNKDVEKKESLATRIVDFMEYYPNGFIPRVIIQEKLNIKPTTARELFRRAFLYGLVEKSGTPHYPKFRLKEYNREKWTLIYKQPPKEYVKLVKSKK